MAMLSSPAKAKKQLQAPERTPDTPYGVKSVQLEKSANDRPYVETNRMTATFTSESRLHRFAGNEGSGRVREKEECTPGQGGQFD